MTASNEEWRPVPNYEGYYEVSSDGRVRSVGRHVIDDRGVSRWYQGCDRRTASRDGYRVLNLYRIGVRTKWSVHVLVAAAFIGPRPPGMEVAHWDGNPSNNHVTNLRYATTSGNQLDRRRHGTSNAGRRNGRAVLTEDQVIEIRRRSAEGERKSHMAALFGVSPSTIAAITSGKSWQGPSERRVTPDDPSLYVKGRVTIGTCGDMETYDGDPASEDNT